MNCPVRGKEARARLDYCAKCAVYVQTKCWEKHIAQAHKK